MNSGGVPGSAGCRMGIGTGDGLGVARPEGRHVPGCGYGQSPYLDSGFKRD